MSTDEITKLRITPNGISGSTRDDSDVVNIKLGHDKVTIDKMVYVQGCRVLWENDFMNFDDTKGILNLNAISTNNLQVRGNDVISNSADFSFDASTGTLTVKHLKVLGDFVFTKPDSSTTLEDPVQQLLDDNQ